MILKRADGGKTIERENCFEMRAFRRMRLMVLLQVALDPTRFSDAYSNFNLPHQLREGWIKKEKERAPENDNFI